MAENNNQQLLLLVGELRGDMKEGQRQRAETFEILRTVSTQLAELSATFSSHAATEENWRKDLTIRIAEIEVQVPDINLRLAAIEQRDGDRRGINGGVAMAGMGGTGLIGALFGTHLIDGWGRFADAVRRLFH